jgi:hypothetical protein
MSYRTRGGPKSEDQLRYSVRLAHQNGQWTIVEMEQNR